MFPIGDDNSSRRTAPLVTYVLIALNVLFFLIELSGGDAFIVKWSFIPGRFLANPSGDFLTLFSAMFMHAGWVHLGGKMLYLWIFGDNVEDRFGHLKFIIFYLLCGFAATFAQLAFNTSSNIPNLGASGAIAGVLGAYILLFPQRQVRVLQGFRVVEIPALVVIGLWIVLQFFSGIGSIANTTDTGGVAYMAHIGGFLAGLMLAFLLNRYGGSQETEGIMSNEEIHVVQPNMIESQSEMESWKLPMRVSAGIFMIDCALMGVGVLIYALSGNINNRFIGEIVQIGIDIFIIMNLLKLRDSARKIAVSWAVFVLLIGISSAITSGSWSHLITQISFSGALFLLLIGTPSKLRTALAIGLYGVGYLGVIFVLAFRPPEPGSTRISAKDGMVLVYIPAGTFTMGSAATDKDAHSDEKPQHTANLDAF